MKMPLLMLLLLWSDKEGAHATQGCGSVISNTLKSPGYPNKYPSNMDCNYTIAIPHNMTMNISFIEDHPSCRYELMSECWNEDPSSRPSFSELIDRLEVIMTRDVPSCDLDKHDEQPAC